GAELVVYRATDQSLKETGIEIAGAVFPGFPISFVDDKADAPDVYGALFGIPFDFDPKEAKVTLFAVDQVGNRSDQQIYFRLGKFNQAKVNSRLSQDFLQRKVPELFDKYKLIADHIPSVDLASESGLLEAFRFVNEDFRKSLDTELATVLNAPITPRQGIGAFIKPMGSATSSNLGEKRTYTFDSKPVSYSVHNGLDLASVQHDDVLAAQSGIVQLAKDFGIYGEAVVIDHGLGVKSLYGHLSSIQVQVGQQVDQGQVIGQTGQTGLAGGDHLHFEIRVRSTPVNPIEWWDSKWINDNIDGKLASLKE
ncbi:MAG: M23 family metallopeptidase, partial [Bdellovibrionales bacterium]|nr:M23 family metallopeptidase [Bdellovibrionales bacterium]